MSGVVLRVGETKDGGGYLSVSRLSKRACLERYSRARSFSTTCGKYPYGRVPHLGAILTYRTQICRTSPVHPLLSLEQPADSACLAARLLYICIDCALFLLGESIDWLKRPVGTIDPPLVEGRCGRHCCVSVSLDSLVAAFSLAPMVACPVCCRSAGWEYRHLGGSVSSLQRAEVKQSVEKMWLHKSFVSGMHVGPTLVVHLQKFIAPPSTHVVWSRLFGFMQTVKGSMPNTTRL